MDGRLCQEEEEIIQAPPPVVARELPSVLMTQVVAWIASARGWRLMGRVRLSHSQCCVGQDFWRNRRKGCNVVGRVVRGMGVC